MRDLTVVHKMHLDALESRLTPVDWRQVDALLAGPAFARLASVRIRADAGARPCSQESHSFYFFSSDDLWDYLVVQEEKSKTEAKRP